MGGAGIADRAFAGRPITQSGIRGALWRISSATDEANIAGRGAVAPCSADGPARER
jgi:hypothetical protein